MWSEEFELRAADMRQRSKRERVVSRIGPDQLRIAEAVGINGAMERHYTGQEIGELRNLSADTITRLFREEPDVLSIGERGVTARTATPCHTAHPRIGGAASASAADG